MLNGWRLLVVLLLLVFIIFILALDRLLLLVLLLLLLGHSLAGASSPSWGLLLLLLSHLLLQLHRILLFLVKILFFLVDLARHVLKKDPTSTPCSFIDIAVVVVLVLGCSLIIADIVRIVLVTQALPNSSRSFHRTIAPNRNLLLLDFIIGLFLLIVTRLELLVRPHHLLKNLLTKLLPPICSCLNTASPSFILLLLLLLLALLIQDLPIFSLFSCLVFFELKLVDP